MINKRKGEYFMKITNRTGENATEITLDMVYGRSALPCEIMEYYLNGKYFDQDDFGESYDKGGYCDSEDIMCYGCVNRVFEPYEDEEHKNEAMAKYGITENEYYKIQDHLESELYVGTCGWCV
jgi:hypothetical protein